MTAIVIAMICIVAIAAVVVVYVAYPHRGEELPVAPRLGDAISKAVDALPTVDPAEAEAARLAEQQPGEQQPGEQGDTEVPRPAPTHRASRP